MTLRPWVYTDEAAFLLPLIFLGLIAVVVLLYKHYRDNP